jgi:hypothetical protein
MDVRWVVEPDPLKQCLLEIYVAVTLATLRVLHDALLLRRQCSLGWIRVKGEDKLVGDHRRFIEAIHAQWASQRGDRFAGGRDCF